jgi:hypothetical protein
MENFLVFYPPPHSDRNTRIKLFSHNFTFFGNPYRIVIILAVLLLLPFSTLAAQSRGLTVLGTGGVTLASFSQSYALVIGESVYTNGWAPRKSPTVLASGPVLKPFLTVTAMTRRQLSIWPAKTF